MGDHALEPWELPDTTGLVTEDDTPVDSFLAEKCQRLLTSALYASWDGPPPHEEDPLPRPFLAAANVGFFATPKQPPLVPDMMVSTDTTLDALHANADEQKSYFLWEVGKPPEVVVEIVSDREGDELQVKRRKYARAHVSHYVVWDPRGVYRGPELRVFTLAGDLLQELKADADGTFLLGGLNLGVRVWEGRFEKTRARWLRFTDGAGRFLPTGEERAEAEKQRAETEKQRAEAEKQRAEAEKQRAERFAAKLRALGVDPDEP